MSYSSRLVTRSELGWGGTKASRAACTRGLVLHYDGSDQNLRNRSHSACLDYWQRTRSFHRNVRGWLDIGYSFGACPHGYILTGRGINRSQAAQPSGNSTYHSCTTMGGPGEPLTDSQVAAIMDLHQHLHNNHGVAMVQKCHSDFISTSCPGDVVRNMVRRGQLLPRNHSEEDVMASKEEVAQEVWDHLISNQFRPDSSGNPRQIAAKDFMEYGDKHYDDVMEKLDSLQRQISELAALVTSQAK